MKKYLFTIALGLFSLFAFGQVQVGSLIKVHSVNTTAMNALTPAETGVLIYNTDDTSLYVYNGSAWEKHKGSGWGLTGNNIVATNFLGSTNNVPLVFKVNNFESGRIDLYQISTALGYQTTAGYKSVAIGSSISSADTGTESVSIGQTSLAKYQSVAVGSAANTTNNQSVAIGNIATAGFQATALGSNTTASANNSTAIGYNTTAAQANTVILGNGANVGIGTATPNNKLEITQGTTGNSGLRLTNLTSAAFLGTNSTGDVVSSLLTTKDLATGTSVNTATSPLVLTNSTGQIVGANDATFTVNNTAPLWNANQLQGKAISTTAPTDGQALVWDTTTSTWKPTNFGVFSVITVPGTTYTLSNADNGKILDFTNSSAITLTAPSTLPIGFQVSITQAGAGAITISGSGMTINNRWGATKTSGQWAKAGLEVRAAGSSVLSGDVQ
ncbi:hypothetical protein [Frigoriflavimonas asaccharolytica]|uniref:Trimeric autotransporter adhesin YadA-like head domain-containing protein n=1 Tax=Frigoriflavimonas asaccharolytica TaxID=2735899 RepID=A0A8J8GAD8_9FLAO|nr:hypothetical protein [Frigoriflavimonas asaccharolytica]NRS91987.1 hypothetical protein [Frigoriflavimonas asaccharolytica]